MSLSGEGGFRLTEWWIGKSGDARVEHCVYCLPQAFCDHSSFVGSGATVKYICGHVSDVVGYDVGRIYSFGCLTRRVEDDFARA